MILETWGGTPPVGHPPVCGANGTTPDGKTWRDMPGADFVFQRLNFFFYRRGMLDVLEGELGPDGRVETASGKRNRKRRGKGRRKS